MNWDGTVDLPFMEDDGARAAAGFKGSAGDCVCRSIAIASGLPYDQVYKRLSAGEGKTVVKGKKRSASARNGVFTNRKWFKDYMKEIGFEWTPTMQIGPGCKVHLLRGELPMGRLVVAVSRHYTAVIDGVIHDTFDPSRTVGWIMPDGTTKVSHRCVYGYWRKK